MKLSDKFILHKDASGVYVVPTGFSEFHGLVRGNKSVMTIVECLMNETTEEEIVRTLLDKYDGSEADIRADVSDVIGKLKKIGAIDEGAGAK